MTRHLHIAFALLLSSTAAVLSWKTFATRSVLELRNPYVLGYHPTNKAKDGRWRKIRLEINPPKGISYLSVHAKTGYYAESLNIKHYWRKYENRT